VNANDLLEILLKLQPYVSLCTFLYLSTVHDQQLGNWS